MGQKWTDAQRKKFMATAKRMRAEGTWAAGKKKEQLIPLDAIPDRPTARKKRGAPVVVGNQALALDLLELAVKLLRGGKS